MMSHSTTAVAHHGRQTTSSSLRLNGDGGAREGPRDATWVTAFGWLSLGLGVAELAAPGRMSRLLGLEAERRGLLRTMGVREIVSGMGILAFPQSAGWMWSRVAGDAVDLALLGAAFRVRGAGGLRNRRLGWAVAAVAGVTIADVLVSRRMSRGAFSDGVTREMKSLTIHRRAEDLYMVWRGLESLPSMLPHLQSVRILDDRRSHWVIRGPGGVTVEWDAEIVEDRPNERIAWRALPESDVHHAGSVSFRPAPGDRGTEVTVTLEYRPPVGKLGSMAAALFGTTPGRQLYDGLRAFKQLMETGEVVRSDASLHQGLHPAQPPEVGISR